MASFDFEALSQAEQEVEQVDQAAVPPKAEQATAKTSCPPGPPGPDAARQAIQAIPAASPTVSGPPVSAAQLQAARSGLQALLQQSDGAMSQALSGVSSLDRARLRLVLARLQVTELAGHLGYSTPIAPKIPAKMPPSQSVPAVDATRAAPSASSGVLLDQNGQRSCGQAAATGIAPPGGPVSKALVAASKARTVASQGTVGDTGSSGTQPPQGPQSATPGQATTGQAIPTGQAIQASQGPAKAPGPQSKASPPPLVSQNTQTATQGQLVVPGASAPGSQPPFVDPCGMGPHRPGRTCPLTSVPGFANLAQRHGLNAPGQPPSQVGVCQGWLFAPLEVVGFDGQYAPGSPESRVFLPLCNNRHRDLPKSLRLQGFRLSGYCLEPCERRCGKSCSRTVCTQGRRGHESHECLECHAD